MNLRESLNQIDHNTDNEYDLRSLYDAVKLTDKQKKKLTKMLEKKKDAKSIYSYLNEAFNKTFSIKDIFESTEDFSFVSNKDDVPQVNEKYNGPYGKQQIGWMKNQKDDYEDTEYSQYPNYDRNVTVKGGQRVPVYIYPTAEDCGHSFYYAFKTTDGSWKHHMPYIYNLKKYADAGDFEIADDWKLLDKYPHLEYIGKKESNDESLTEATEKKTLDTVAQTLFTELKDSLHLESFETEDEDITFVAILLNEDSQFYDDFSEKENECNTIKKALNKLKPLKLYDSYDNKIYSYKIVDITYEGDYYRVSLEATSSKSLTEATDNGNDPHEHRDLGYFNRTRFSVDIYDNTGNIYIHSSHPYDDADYSWARSKDGGKTFDIFRSGRILASIENSDKETYKDVINELIDLDKDVKPRMVYESATDKCTITIARDDAEKALRYADSEDEEIDFSWLTKEYNVSFDEVTDHKVVISGNCKDIDRFVKDHHLEDYNSYERLDEAYRRLPVTIDEITKISYNGAEYRGARIPDFNRISINQIMLPDNMRTKSYNTVVTDSDKNEITFFYTTQEEFDGDDANQFTREVRRAFKEYAEYVGYDKPFILHLDVECRDGKEYGYIDKDIVITPRSMNEAAEEKTVDVIVDEDNYQKILDQTRTHKHAASTAVRLGDNAVNEQEEMPFVTFYYRVYKIDDEGEEISVLDTFEDEKKAKKFAQEQNVPTHVVFVPVPDSDAGEDYAEYISYKSPYEDYEVIATYGLNEDMKFVDKREEATIDNEDDYGYDEYDDFELSGIYGGDMTYCPMCGARLQYTEDGDHVCPKCKKSAFSLAMERRKQKLELDEDTSPKDEIITLHYTNLPVVLQGSKQEADSWEEEEVLMDYNFKLTKDDIINYFIDNVLQTEFLDVDVSDDYDKAYDLALSNFRNLFNKYKEKIKEFFFEEAKEEAEEKAPSYDEYYRDLAYDYADSKFDEDVTQSVSSKDSKKLTPAELYKLFVDTLEKNNLRGDVYYNKSDDGKLMIDVEVNRGDWKHEHLALYHFIYEALFNAGIHMDYEDEITETDESDTYSAIHHFILTDPIDEAYEGPGLYAFTFMRSEPVKTADKRIKGETVETEVIPAIAIDSKEEHDAYAKDQLGPHDTFVKSKKQRNFLEEVDVAYTKEEIFDQLKEITHNSTEPRGHLKTYFAEEKEYAKEYLSKEYEVEVSAEQINNGQIIYHLVYYKA